MKKYVIEMNEKQARILSWACDTLPRLIQGQRFALQDLLEEAWEKRCKKATGKSMDEEFEGGWSAMRSDAENVTKELNKRFWKLSDGFYNGIHYDKTADMLWDMHQVIRHQLWLDNPNPDKSKWTVDAFSASQIGEEPLIEVRSYDIDK